MNDRPPSPTQTLSPAEVEAVLGDLRSSLAAVIAGLGAPITRPTDLQKLLRLDSALAWSIYRTATAETPLAAGQYVPGPGMLARFLRESRERGVSPAAARAAEEAFAAFERLLKEHAGERESFLSLLGEFSARDAAKEDLKHKRAAFRAARHLYGVYARVGVVTTILSARPGSRRLDSLQINGYADLVQLRQKSRVVGATQAKWFPLSGAAGADAGASLPPAGQPFPLVDFCSSPFPEIRVVEGPEGRSYTEVLSRGLGSRAAMSYFLCTRYRELYDWDVFASEVCEFVFQVALAAEAFVWDLIVPRDLWGDVRLDVAVYSPRRFALEAPRLWDSDQLPFTERAADLGAGLEHAAVPEAPDYVAMLRSVLGGAGLSERDLRLIRCRIEYPLMHVPVRVAIAGERPGHAGSASAG